MPTPFASAQSDQSSLCTQWVAKDPSFLHADIEDSDQTGRMPFCWFCHEAAQLPDVILENNLNT